ncbi:MAG TPA: MarR family transcriptional regulator [Clostridiales bacterium]|nr:MarR family transcriptional regulator [Clostridiales bacterium]
MNMENYQDSYFKLLSFEKSFRQFTQKKVPGADVSLALIMILRYLEENGSCGQKELTVTFNASSAAMAVSIGKLEERELIIKEVADDDKRNNIISLTEKGEALLAQVAASSETAEAKVEAPMSEEELSQLTKLQKKLFRQLKTISINV